MQREVFTSWLTPKAVVGPSKVAGTGLVTQARIAQGELVAVWGGHLMSFAELQQLPEDVRGHPVQIWHDLFVGPIDINNLEPVDYMNHSCEPNCGVKGQIIVVARRDIESGEELTFDYATTDTVGLNMECSCGRPACRGRITSDDWESPEFRKRNGGYLSTYIEEMARMPATASLP
jgi:hypothetical protein